MSEAKPRVPCDVQGCVELTRSARQFEHEGQPVWLMLCGEHYRRIEAQQPYVLVTRPFDLNDVTSIQPNLFMED